uniref:Uncharacterized protein n=1 Tax=Anguilla anguilla TaxID=7936 RepID=A0A0E9QWN0_ANGAN
MLKTKIDYICKTGELTGLGMNYELWLLPCVALSF